MAAPMPGAGLVYDDLASFPDDHLRRELIAGELIVTPAPRTRHQAVVAVLTARLFEYSRTHGGTVLPAPTDVVFAPDTVLEPDVIFVTAGHQDRVGELFVQAPPDLVVKVSSPSTRHLELIRKRAVYEEHAVPEYWFVDLEAERVEVYRLVDDAYGAPSLHFADDTITPPCLQEFSITVREILGLW